MSIPARLTTLFIMKSITKFFYLATLAVIIASSCGQEEQCSGKIGDECTRTTNCCTGFCYNGICIEEPCNLMGRCLNDLECINYDNCTTCPCQRKGGCFAPSNCSKNNCTCLKWDDCTSGCCSEGKCVENPDYTICNPCCLAKCNSSMCALEPIACFRAPCNALPICVVDPLTNCTSQQCPEGQICKFEAQCYQNNTSNNCARCVIPAPF